MLGVSCLTSRGCEVSWFLDCRWEHVSRGVLGDLRGTNNPSLGHCRCVGPVFGLCRPRQAEARGSARLVKQKEGVTFGQRGTTVGFETSNGKRCCALPAPPASLDRLKGWSPSRPPGPPAGAAGSLGKQLGSDVRAPSPASRERQAAPLVREWRGDWQPLLSSSYGPAGGGAQPTRHVCGGPC